MTSQRQSVFGRGVSVEQVEEGKTLAPRLNDQGLIPVVTTDAVTGELLMHGYMNAEALAKTIETAEAYYWSRSRNALWRKGATSGFVQRVVEMRIDDDQDAGVVTRSGWGVGCQLSRGLPFVLLQVRAFGRKRGICGRAPVVRRS